MFTGIPDTPYNPCKPLRLEPKPRREGGRVKWLAEGNEGVVCICGRLIDRKDRDRKRRGRPAKHHDTTTAAATIFR